MFNIPDSEKQNNKASIRPERARPGREEDRRAPLEYLRDLRPPLSKAHIRPRIEYVEGASYLKTSKGVKVEVEHRGKRGAIQGFSKAARRRLLYLIGHIRTDAELPCFVTLTYPDRFPDVYTAKRDLKIFLQRLHRKFSQAGWIWKLEPQERGAPHYHLLVWGVSDYALLNWVVDAWYEIAGNGDPNHKLFHMGLLRDSKPCVSQVRSWRGVWSYASKYLGKTFEVAGWGDQWTGRFWGTGFRDNIPFGRSVEIVVPYRYVIRIMRYQRRFTRGKVRAGSSSTILCDADHWIDQLDKEFRLLQLGRELVT